MRTIEEILKAELERTQFPGKTIPVTLEELEAWQADRDELRGKLSLSTSQREAELDTGNAVLLDRIALLDDLMRQMGKQRRRDGLAGQATLDEANNRIAELERQLEHADLIITKYGIYGIYGKSPWTPVSEGLPEVSIACLLQMQNGEYIPAKRVSSTHVHPDGDLEDLNNGDVINPAQVLRWMFIPEYKPED